MNEYGILSAIYKILGESSKDTLERIERSGKQPKEIRLIIKAIKDARSIIDSRNNINKLSRKKGIREEMIDTGVFSEKNSWSNQARKVWDGLQTSLSDTKKQKIMNKNIINAFRECGLDTKARAKEGRNKMLVMLESELNNLEDSKRIRVLESVLAKLGLSQTMGYIEAIKSKEV